METGSPAPQVSEERHRVTGLLRALALYVEARGRLLQIESQEAGSRISGSVGLFMVTMASFIIGWLLAAPALVWLIAQQTDLPWPKVALIGAGAHLMFGMIFLIVLRLRIRRMHLFEETFNQLRRDREWLASNKND